MAFRLQSGLRITSWLRKKSVGIQKEIDQAETDIVPRVTRGVRGPVTVRAWLPLVLAASLFGLMDPTLAPTPPLCLNGRPVQLHQVSSIFSNSLPSGRWMWARPFFALKLRHHS